MMKKLLIVIIVLGLLISITGCDSNKIEDIYGTYTFVEVSYLSAFSSSSISRENEEMKGMEFVIEADRFIGGTKFNPYDLSSPEYRKEKVFVKYSTIDAIRSISYINPKCQYSIYMKSGTATLYRLYVSSGDLWIASYGLTGIGTEFISYIYKLKKE